MTSPKVLLIDRDPDSIKIYTLMLSHYGFAVFHAQDPENGYRLAIEAHPDVVVAELFFPHQQGGALLQRLLGHERIGKVPIIILDSAAAMRHQAPAVKRLYHLTKPCEPSRLLHEIQRLLGRSPDLA